MRLFEGVDASDICLLAGAIAIEVGLGLVYGPAWSILVGGFALFAWGFVLVAANRPGRR